jgi:hypothetical protein
MSPSLCFSSVPASGSSNRWGVARSIARVRRRSLRMLNDVKFVSIIGRRCVAVAKPYYPGFNRVIEPLIPNKQPFGDLLMENGRMRSPIDMVPIDPGAVEGRNCGPPRKVAALHQFPTPPERSLGRPGRLLDIRNTLAISNRLADKARGSLSDPTHEAILQKISPCTHKAIAASTVKMLRPRALPSTLRFFTFTSCKSKG